MRLTTERFFLLNWPVLVFIFSFVLSLFFLLCYALGLGVAAFVSGPATRCEPFSVRNFYSYPCLFWHNLTALNSSSLLRIAVLSQWDMFDHLFRSIQLDQSQRIGIIRFHQSECGGDQSGEIRETTQDEIKDHFSDRQICCHRRFLQTKLILEYNLRLNYIENRPAENSNSNIQYPYWTISVSFADFTRPKSLRYLCLIAPGKT